VVEADSRVQPLVQRLLGLTFIVGDLSSATAAWRETDGTFDFVTLSGELLSRHGVYTGGYLNGNGSGKAPSSVLGRKNQIAELQADLAGLQERLGEGKRRKDVLLKEQVALQAGLHQDKYRYNDEVEPHRILRYTANGALTETKVAVAAE